MLRILVKTFREELLNPATKRGLANVATEEKMGAEALARFDLASNSDRRARELIFSARHYSEFSDTEKALVDAYQEKLLRVDGGMILPNTGAEQEQMMLEKLSKNLGLIL